MSVFDRERRCAHDADALALVGADYRWPPGVVVTWWLNAATVPGTLHPIDVSRAIDRGFAAHARASAVLVGPVASPAKARVHVSFDDIDRSGVTLALTQLPAGATADTQLAMRFNVRVAWTLDALFRVAMHEAGHGLGLGHHDPGDGTAAVMDPIYNPGLDDLQPWDAAQDVERYGALPKPTPAPTAVPAWLHPFVFDFTIPEPGAYRITGQVDTIDGTVRDATLTKTG